MINQEDYHGDSSTCKSAVISGERVRIGSDRSKMEREKRGERGAPDVGSLAKRLSRGNWF